MYIAVLTPEGSNSFITFGESYAEIILNTINFIKAYDANNEAIILHDQEPIENINSLGRYHLYIANSKVGNTFELNIVKIEDNTYTKL